MFCTKCGNKLPDNAHFCPKCGNPVRSVPKAQDTSDTGEAPVRSARTNVQPQSTYKTVPIDLTIRQTQNTKTNVDAAQAKQQYPKANPAAAQSSQQVQSSKTITGTIAAQQAAKPKGKASKAAAQAPKKKKGKGRFIAVLALLLVAVIGVKGFSSGWFRGTVSGSKTVDPADRTGTNTAAMLEYAKKLEDMGNPEAAAAIYTKLQEAGQGDMDQAIKYYRNDMPRLMLDALSDEDIYKNLSQKGGNGQ